MSLFSTFKITFWRVSITRNIFKFQVFLSTCKQPRPGWQVRAKRLSCLCAGGEADPGLPHIDDVMRLGDSGDSAQMASAGEQPQPSSSKHTASETEVDAEREKLTAPDKEHEHPSSVGVEPPRSEHSHSLSREQQHIDVEPSAVAKDSSSGDVKHFQTAQEHSGVEQKHRANKLMRNEDFGVPTVEYFDKTRRNWEKHTVHKNGGSANTDRTSSGGDGDSGGLAGAKAFVDFSQTHVNDVAFPDPIDYSTLDRTKVQKIIRQRSTSAEGVKSRTSSVIYHVDSFGYVKMESYTQTVDERSGAISVRREEHVERVPERVTHAQQLEEYAQQVAADRARRQQLGVSFKHATRSFPDGSDLGNVGDEEEVLFDETPEETAEAMRLEQLEAEMTEEQRQGEFRPESPYSCTSLDVCFREVTCRVQNAKVFTLFWSTSHKTCCLRRCSGVCFFCSSGAVRPGSAVDQHDAQEERPQVSTGCGEFHGFADLVCKF